jgi:hypothetical protein
MAAVVPLLASSRVRRFADPWALALGAMVPDLPLFLPFLPDYTDWHSWSGVVTLDLAAVLVLLPLFHVVFRDPLVTLLPAALAGRAALLAPERLRLLPMAAGAVIGPLRISPRARWSVLTACAAGTAAGALLWPLVDEPSPELGVPSVLTKTGVGTLIGLCLVLTCYAVVWQVRRRMTVSEGA